jgi:type III restriction enzyme
MEFKFDPNQEFQVKAIEAVTDLFDGQPRLGPAMHFAAGPLFGVSAIPNRLDLDEPALLANLEKVQTRNGIRPDASLQCIEQGIETLTGPKTARFPNFSVEMETGTGKTYVYLRTILELHKRYGMLKFIIVVPSVAIREGVQKTLQITEKHFKTLYGNPVYRSYVYDSSNLSQVRQFAQTSSVEILVMTIDSFNKASNVIRQSTDRLQGETPIHLIQAARPILILDEPQNMESEKSIKALAALDPLFALRYSATHRVPYNIVYRLSPADAYRQGLVKKIEVDSVITEGQENLPYLALEDIQARKTRLTARLRVHRLAKKGSVAQARITVKPGDSLEAKTNRAEYAPFVVDEINRGAGFVRFANNVELRIGEEIGADRYALFDAQIRQTIEEHFRKQQRLRRREIKVLSLFFIDRVANYAAEDGIIRQLFNRAFEELKATPEFRDTWGRLDAAKVQAAYFAEKRHRGGEVELVDSVGGDNKQDEAAYDLIMKNKERLLSFDEPVSFIFSHSALREGWDNPNIFQICTLNQSVSPMKKRQEIGRGVRLAVNQAGDRLQDEQVNILTVVANESYRLYVETLQSEITEEYRDQIQARFGKALDELTHAEWQRVEKEYGIPPPPRKARTGRSRLRKQRHMREDFKELWDRLRQKTRYSVRIDTEGVLGQVVRALNRTSINPPRLVLERAEMDLDEETGGFRAMLTSQAKTLRHLRGRFPLPNLLDVMGDLMEHTSPQVRLTRHTLLEVFRRARNQSAALENPHEWATAAVRLLKQELLEQLVSGIQYEKINEWYEMQQILDDKVVELFCELSWLADPQKDKTLYDLVPCDSEVERQFAEDMEARKDVLFYLKLPGWFTVETPVGKYNPDWAVVMETEQPGGEKNRRLYLVRETKSTHDRNEWRLDEARKVACGEKHFETLGVDYKVVTSASELL